MAKGRKGGEIHFKMDNDGRGKKLFNGNESETNEKKIPQIIINKSIYILGGVIHVISKLNGKYCGSYKMVLFSKELLNFVSVVIMLLALL